VIPIRDAEALTVDKCLGDFAETEKERPQRLNCRQCPRNIADATIDGLMARQKFKEHDLPQTLVCARGRLLNTA
jgi:hypothetical protein